jgi:hypothetical protein
MTDLNSARWRKVEQVMRAANDRKCSTAWARVWLDHWFNAIDTHMRLGAANTEIIKWGKVELRADRRLLQILFGEMT